MPAKRKEAASSSGSKAKLSGTEQVEVYMRELEHPLKPEIEAVRSIIKGARPGIGEHIKWNAPSFHDEGEDRITFNLRKQDCLLLVFHTGAKGKDRAAGGPLITLHNMENIRAKEMQLVEVIHKWLDA
ncbi:DUF1801 domain-containing protein [Paenibacillus sp. 1011MAR3C5]|uniref:DUF1801 domain-containing protein n=1 Tax=Paenibacillus sp. 1011MAR3C5 TaxID=1675787 RepID=UPI000E6C9F76|nr:DUF1801 domain-containing protein [Paenibacillus sp. 1011MAR3C5]RJE89589.1 DUF1801 domain-containing protein [Paenibacillus sp. 1011MAR3C5]